MSTTITEQAVHDRDVDARQGALHLRVRGPAQRRLAVQGRRFGLRRRARRRHPAGQRATASAITVNDENLQGHLLSPDFFDVERTPRVSFESTSISRDGGKLIVEGQLEIRGVTQPVTLTGSIAGPVEGPAGERIGITLETVIDRTTFGITWNMELPSGGFILDNQVTLTANLELARA